MGADQEPESVLQSVRALVGDTESFTDAASRGSFVRRGAIEPTDLFSWDELNRLLNFTDIPRNLALEGRFEQRISSQRALAAVQEGATLQLWHTERYSPRAATICGELSRLLGDPVRCNLYLAPPHQESSFGVHHDLTDALIVQLSGGKRWRVWQPLVPSALREHVQDTTGVPPALDLVLEPGDVLFVEGGAPHGAVTEGDESSMHLTLALLRATGQHLLEWLVRRSRQEPALRTAWPRGNGDQATIESRAAWLERLVADLAAWLGRPPADELLDEFLKERAATTVAPAVFSFPATLPGSNSRIDASSVVSLATPLLRPHISGSCLYSLGKQVRIPSDLLPVFLDWCAEPVRSVRLGDLASRHGIEVPRLSRVVDELVQLGIARVTLD